VFVTLNSLLKRVHHGWSLVQAGGAEWQNVMGRSMCVCVCVCVRERERERERERWRSGDLDDKLDYVFGDSFFEYRAMLAD